MTYFIFLCKKTYKNAFNMIPAVLSFILILLMYLQITMGAHNVYKALDIPETPPSPAKNIDYLHQAIQVYNLTSEDEIYGRIIHQIDVENERSGRSIDADELPNGGWTAYQLYYMTSFVHTKNEAIKMNESSDVIELRQKYIDYYQYQIDHNLPFEDEGDYRNGVSFLLFAVQRLLTILVIVMIVYLAAGTLSSMKTENISQASVLPVSSFAKVCIELVYGLCIGMTAAALILLISYVMGVIGNGSGSLEQGIYNYWIMQYEPVRNMVPAIVLLFLCGLPLIIGIVKLVTVFFHDSMGVITISVAVIIGLMYITSAYPALSSFAHLIPFSYLRVFETVTGEISYLMKNTSATVQNGCMTLLVSSLIVWTAAAVLQKRI